MQLQYADWNLVQRLSKGRSDELKTDDYARWGYEETFFRMPPLLNRNNPWMVTVYKTKDSKIHIDKVLAIFDKVPFYLMTHI